MDVATEKEFADAANIAENILTDFGPKSVISHLAYELTHLVICYNRIYDLSKRKYFFFRGPTISSEVTSKAFRQFMTVTADFTRTIGIIACIEAAKESGSEVPVNLDMKEVESLQEDLDAFTGHVRSLKQDLSPLVGMTHTFKSYRSIGEFLKSASIPMKSAMQKSVSIIDKTIDKDKISDELKTFNGAGLVESFNEIMDQISIIGNDLVNICNTEEACAKL